MSKIDSSGLLAMRSAILQQNAALQKAAGVGPAGTAGMSGTAAAGESSFGGALTSAIAQVNELQARSTEMSTAYERGETTDIAAVMLSREKASVGFQATLQVRNKLLSAYKDIMSMPV
ncbi:MAG TPA: flagellar hook-basal body complex protein FliE [Sphingomonadaceae bacterium]|nr:flagellar hook-basal body complex protein FliE [Sphingomonadaceae bacterium]